jgi:hypothetical protein
VTALRNAVPFCYSGNMGIGCIVPNIPALRYAVLAMATVPLIAAVVVRRDLVALVCAAAAYLLASASDDFHAHYWAIVFVLGAIVVGSVRDWKELAETFYIRLQTDWRARFLTALAILFLRRPETLLQPSLWADDGPTYVDALLRGAGTVVEPFHGFLVVGWRLLLLPVAALPPTAMPFGASALAVLPRRVVDGCAADRRLAGQ